MAVFGGIEQLKILSVWLNWGSQRLLPYTVSCLDDRLDLGFRGLLVISSALLRAGPSDHFSMNCNYRVAIINICWRIYINIHRGCPAGGLPATGQISRLRAFLHRYRWKMDGASDSTLGIQLANWDFIDYLFCGPRSICGFDGDHL